MALCLGCGAEPVSAPEPLDLRLSPEPPIAGLAHVAMDRWNKARGCFDGSGCEFSVSEQGIPVQFVDKIIDPADGGTRGGATRRNEYVRISRTATNPERTLVHELGHKLGLQHMESGVMVTTGGPVTLERALQLEAYTINDDVLSAACAVSVCLEFNPEVSPR